MDLGELAENNQDEEDPDMSYDASSPVFDESEVERLVQESTASTSVPKTRTQIDNHVI